MLIFILLRSWWSVICSLFCLWFRIYMKSPPKYLCIKSSFSTCRTWFENVMPKREGVSVNTWTQFVSVKSKDSGKRKKAWPSIHTYVVKEAVLPPHTMELTPQQIVSVCCLENERKLLQNTQQVTWFNYMFWRLNETCGKQMQKSAWK